MKRHKTFICLGIGIIIAGLILLLLFLETNPRKISISNIPFSDSSTSFLYIDHIEESSGGYAVYGAARDNSLSYDYHNWTMGDGADLYRKRSLILMDEDGTEVWELKTLPYSFSPEQSENDAEFFHYSGFKAFLPKNLMSDTSMKFAILFYDREGEKSLHLADENCVGRIE